MCLYCVEYYTVEMRNKFKNLVKTQKIDNPYIDFFKLYDVSRDGLLPRIFSRGAEPIKGPGFIVSNRKSKKASQTERFGGIRHRGIHVYNYIIGSKRSLRWAYVDCAVYVPVRGYYKDFVAASRTEALFMKVEITKETWQAFKKLSRK